MAYMHGNLALQPKKRPDQSNVVKEKKRVVVRRKSLPVQEKLLYLFTIAVCVIVAGVIIFRYSQIYQMDMKIQDMSRQHDVMAVEIKELQKKVEQLSDPEIIKQKALQVGMVLSEESINLTMEDAPGQLAMRE
ncbi:cell division initiation protein [Paenibacillus abyssi]|uniref:Cell division protein FtsL n=1 Tax=Paenibacillus abyssi TaxID=1340531 RepID=A0A917FVZ3_9BACL|nr:cell division initiation protein [Paenibacillus abyssi]GGG10286.1 hypothetical protein GCM10010916_28950 [Paenibacillus abyssi]